MSRRKKIVVAVIAASVLGIAAVGCAETPSEKSAEAAKPKAAKSEQKAAKPKAAKSEQKAEKADPVAEEAPAETAGQENAREAAATYLDTMAFSRSGLIEQLKYEGYSTKDATYAVDAVSPNWNEQAAKAAATYLDTMAFSRSSLIQQLEYEGYTKQQAVYGVNQTGL